MAIMEADKENPDLRRSSAALSAAVLAVVFGSLGTSPLFAVRSLVSIASGNPDALLVYGGLSCIFWTLTLLATIKYVFVSLESGNNGEGGIFALFSLIKSKAPWAALLTMTAGAAFLADSVIMPAITITSSMEGFKILKPLLPVFPIVLIIITLLFFVQQFGVSRMEKFSGGVMAVWFVILASLGIRGIMIHPGILKALSPAYAFHFIKEYPGGFILLGAVFLSVTGAEMIYAGLGSFGSRNIRISWTFVKTALVLNYFGQGAWVMSGMESAAGTNPFFSMMPSWFLVPGIIIASAASIIASQSIIRGSFSLMGEAVSLNLWPKIKILHPTKSRVNIYIPFVNWFLWILCSLTVVIFRESLNMTMAYGLAINIMEIMTTLLLSYYLLQKGISHRLVLILLMVYLLTEGSFLIANLNKFSSGGWYTILITSVLFLVMYGWYFGRKLKNRYITFADLDKYLDLFRDLSGDESIPLYATNLVYIIRANREDQVESKVIYSIFYKQPRRAKTYWLLHVDRVDEPNRFDYRVKQIIPGLLIRVDFRIGFKVDPRINLYFREVIEDMMEAGEISPESGYDSLKKHGLRAEFIFVLIDRIMLRDFRLSASENFILMLHLLVRQLGQPEEKALHLDSTSLLVEKVPIIIDQPVSQRIRRIKD
jgi:KUP system potassium uptake protein